MLEFLAAAIRRQTCIRDYIAGEKVIQGFPAAYLGATDHFVFHTERELGDRYADICLEPFLVRFVDMRHGYLIELKYLKRSASATEERVAASRAAARSKPPTTDRRFSLQSLHTRASLAFYAIRSTIHHAYAQHCPDRTPSSVGRATGCVRPVPERQRGLA